MKKGFTLLELIIVIIIVGVLASLAAPQYFRAVERGRLAEGTSLLGLLRSAQLRYYAEKAALTTSLGDLDVDYTIANFFTMAVLAPTYAEGAIIATATRNTTQNPGYGSYVLSIEVDGDITCTAGAGLCARLGY